MLMAISSRFFFPPSSFADNPTDIYVGTKKSDADFIQINAETIRNAKSRHDSVLAESGSLNDIENMIIRKYTTEHYVDLFVNKDGVEARHGKVNEIEGALKALEGDLWDYMFGPTKPLPIKSVSDTGIRQSDRSRSETLPSISYKQDPLYHYNLNSTL
jgi:hypothetical protein